MANHPSRLELRVMMDAFLGLRTVDDLCRLLEEEELHIFALAANPEYREFHVPKKNGEFRLIEDPCGPLKDVQRKLNDCLQGVYYFHKSTAAHGFLTSCADDPPHLHRNIVSNARQHLGRPWMLNMDIEDFFHAVKADQVAWVFLSKPFGFDDELAGLLMRLTTYKGRLAMGAPTSPILSNFATKLLDEDLETLAHSRQWVYSRYADDMTFSSMREIRQDDVELLRDYYRAHGFVPKEQKVKLMGPIDIHSVTGIVIREDRLDLETEFFNDLYKEIGKLADVASVKGRLGVTLSDWVEDYRDKIDGMIQFADYVLGDDHERVRQARQAVESAMSPPLGYGPFSWLDFPYHF